MKKYLALTAIQTALLSTLLSACGGGDDSTTPPTGGGDTHPPAVASLTLNGTAATGAAIAGGTIDVKCASGSGSTTTIADGSYTITLSGGTLPCVMHVTASNVDLYSLAEAASGSGGDSVVRANITPLSQLVAAQVAGGDPANLFANFDASAQTLLTAGNVSKAIASVTVALGGVVDLAGVDPLKDPLIATSAGTTGNALDQKLDALKAALAAAGVTLADVTATLVASGPDGPAPVKTLLQPAASSCAGLRSGSYRALNPNESDPAWANHVFTFDAATLTAKFFDATTMTFTDEGHCVFSANAGASKLLVSKSGAIVSLDAASPSTNVVSIVIPEQSLPVSDLAGTWNVLSFERASAGALLKPSTATFTLDAAGKFTAGSDCAGLTACTAWDGVPGNLVADEAGGFRFTDTDGAVYKVYALKTADGKLSLYVMEPDNMGFSVAARNTAQTLPEVQSVNKFWDLSISGNGYAGAVTDTTVTIVSADAATASFTRTRASDGRVDAFTIDKPRDGLRYRAAGSSPLTNGGTTNFSEIISMQLPGTGLSVYVSVPANQNFFGISVNHD